MKFLYECTNSNNSKSSCIFDDDELPHSSFKDRVSFEIQTGSFFSKTISFVVICKSCLSILLVKKFKVDLPYLSKSNADFYSGAGVKLPLNDVEINFSTMGVFDYASPLKTNMGKSPVKPKPEHKEFIESIYNAYNDNNFDNPKWKELSSFIEQERLLQLEQEKKNRDEQINFMVQRKTSIENEIINLLKKQNIKMPASDIDARLKHQDVEEIKEYCEKMYHNGKISRTGNYRYFILTD